MKQSLIPTVSQGKTGLYFYPSNSSMASSSFDSLSVQSKTFHDDSEVGVAGHKSRCSSREGVLAAAVVALLLLVAVLIALVATFSDPCRHYPGPTCKPDQPSKAEGITSQEKPCLSASCIKLASRVVASVDPQVAPCDDFFEYACGSFGEGELLPVAGDAIDAYTLASRNNMQRIRRVLEEPDFNIAGMDSGAVRKTKTYYKSCLNIHTLNQNGRVAALKLIKELGSWPLTSDPLSGRFDPATFDLEQRLSRAFRYLVFPLVLVEVEQDIFIHNQDREILQFGPGSVSLHSAVGWSKATQRQQHDAFVAFFKTVTSLLGASPEGVDQMAEKIWQLNEAIARITPTSILNNVDRPTIAEFSARLQGYLDVSKLLRLTFGEDMPETEKVLVLGKDYFNSLGTVLDQVDKGLLATYITWQVLVSLIPYLGPDLRRAQHQAELSLSADTHPPPRWETCVSRTLHLFPSVVDALYVQRFYPDTARREGEAIMEFLQQEMWEQLPAIPWMDNQTLEEAGDKLQALTHHVGYFHRVTDPQALEGAWAHITPLTDDDELSNLQIIREANYRKSFRERANADNTSWWDKSATETLGTYDRFINQLVFTAGLFQFPFFETEFPRAMKFGAMGTAMAQEIMHVVDTKGRYNDAQGSFKDWWSPHVARAFINQTKCFRSELGGSQPNIDAFDMADKLVADSGALRLAYSVYRDYMSENGRQEVHTVLPAVNLTETQLFFLSYAQRFCVRDNGLPVGGGGRAEDTNRFRVISSLQNSEEFAKAFHCPIESAMNPETKCSVW